MKVVSLYIPCFNAARTIQSCLEAAFKQTYPLKEIVIVDDGSTDGTQNIVSRYPVRFIKHINNQGLAATRNTAIKNIDTEFIASLDADCVADADWLKILMKHFNTSKIVGAGGKLSEINTSSIFDLWRSVHMKQYWQDEEVNPPFLFGSNTVFRKDTLMNAGLYNEDYNNNYEDVDICFRLKQAEYLLIYEPKAYVKHLKSDDIRSILNNFWSWNLGYYQEKGFYSNLENLLIKVRDNIGLANRYIEEDIAAEKFKLLYLDFLLALHHSLKDFEYFIDQNKGSNNLYNSNYRVLNHWLAFLDLNFFYYFYFDKKKIPTIIPNVNAFLQNFFAINLILGKVIKEKFKSYAFRKILYKHLSFSLYKTCDTILVEKLLNQIESNKDWRGLLEKDQANINIIFLKELFLTFKKWLQDLKHKYPVLIKWVEASAKEVEQHAFST